MGRVWIGGGTVRIEVGDAGGEVGSDVLGGGLIPRAMPMDVRKFARDDPEG
jgi:hypothetical protein